MYSFFLPRSLAVQRAKMSVQIMQNAYPRYTQRLHSAVVARKAQQWHSSKRIIKRTQNENNKPIQHTHIFAITPKKVCCLTNIIVLILFHFFFVVYFTKHSTNFLFSPVISFEQISPAFIPIVYIHCFLFVIVFVIQNNFKISILLFVFGVCARSGWHIITPFLFCC